jgi:hypothetical protein
MNTETKFTKGKWVAVPKSEDGAVILCGNNANLVSGKNIIFMNDKVYDSHLIAAAPEMYGMLRNLLCNYEIGLEVDNEIDELLAKARGEL